MQLQEAEGELKAKGVSVAVVTFDEIVLARAYVEETGMKWPLLVDRDRVLYRAYGMDRRGWWAIYGPSALWVYLRLLTKGRRLQRPGSDVHQLGGDVLIDPGGVVRFHHVGAGPAKRPAVEYILQRVD